MQAVIKDIRWLKIIVWIFIFLGSIYIISLFLPFNFLTRFNLFVPRSLESVYWTWLAAIVFGQLLFNKDMHILYKVALGLLIIAIIVAGLSPDRREWTSGWLPPLLAIGTILWLRSWKMGLAATILGCCWNSGYQNHRFLIGQWYQPINIVLLPVLQPIQSCLN